MASKALNSLHDELCNLFRFNNKLFNKLGNKFASLFIRILSLSAVCARKVVLSVFHSLSLSVFLSDFFQYFSGLNGNGGKRNDYSHWGWKWGSQWFASSVFCYDCNGTHQCPIMSLMWCAALEWTVAFYNIAGFAMEMGNGSEVLKPNFTIWMGQIRAFKIYSIIISHYPMSARAVVWKVQFKVQFFCFNAINSRLLYRFNLKKKNSNKYESYNFDLCGAPFMWNQFWFRNSYWINIQFNIIK